LNIIDVIYLKMEMSIRAETPRAKKGWGMGSTMMAGGSKIRGVKLLITEIRDGEEKNVRIIHKLSAVFSSMAEGDEDIELSNQEYGIKVVKTIAQENYNNDMWDQWVLFSRKIYDSINKILKGK
tara:strand:+ start:547 stop:918 length:372 start_codon:yes stop_codon:yes gene_type:complete